MSCQGYCRKHEEICNNQKQCIYNDYEEIIIKEELKNKIKECDDLIQQIKNGHRFYGVTLKGLLHKKNILTEEMMKNEKC